MEKHKYFYFWCGILIPFNSASGLAGFSLYLNSLRIKIFTVLVGYVLNEHILHLQGCEAALMEEELHVLFTFFCLLSVLNQMLNFALVLMITLSSIIKTLSVSSHSLDRVMERGEKWTLN